MSVPLFNQKTRNRQLLTSDSPKNDPGTNTPSDSYDFPPMPTGKKMNRNFSGSKTWDCRKLQILLNYNENRKSIFFLFVLYKYRDFLAFSECSGTRI